jgi:pyruvate dehydrogenase E1 component beta subunit
MRKITYAEAINETLAQMLEKDERVLLIGQGVTSPWYVGSTTKGLADKFGSMRVIDTPVSENAVTGAAVGAALSGMRPIVMHPRMDFMYYAMDAICNHAAPWYYMFGGQLSVPLTIWTIINRGGEQGAQHSQALHSVFAHIPGLKVVMPSTPYDAKGLLVSSIEDDNPVVFVDERWLYSMKGEVPEKLYRVPIGKGEIKRKGRDVTIAAASYMVHEALKAAEELTTEGIDAEVLDLRTIKPLDSELILSSVKKTRRLLVADCGWKSYGASAEVAATVAESPLFDKLASPIKRIALPDSPAPASSSLEKKYFKGAKDIVSTIKKMMEE